MKKTFALRSPGKANARVIEAIKSDVRKYVKRERRKDLPEGFEVWEFSCRVGLDATTSEAKALKEVGIAIDHVAGTDAESVFVEIVAVPARRAARTLAPGTDGPLTTGV